MKETIKTIKAKLWRYGLLCFFAIVLPFVSFFCPFMPTTETQASWFQRSGSIMVVMTIWVQFKLFAIAGYLDPSDTAYVVPFDTPKVYSTMHNIISLTTTVVMILGTLIWGYGDIPFGK